MWNQLIAALTGLGIVTTPAVFLWCVVAGLNVAINNKLQIAEWVHAKPKLSAAVGVLEGAGFDPVKTATKVRDFLKREETLVQ